MHREKKLLLRIVSQPALVLNVELVSMGKSNYLSKFNLGSKFYKTSKKMTFITYCRCEMRRTHAGGMSESERKHLEQEKGTGIH